MLALLHELLQTLAAGRGAVFTALVETRGSTPQKAGATMLVHADGSQHGTLGGGCVEAEVKRRALESLSAGSTQLASFQLNHDYGWDDGLICGGKMVMLIDPVRPGDDVSYYERLAEMLGAGEGATEAVLLDGADDVAAGSRYLFDARGDEVARRGAGDGSAGLLRVAENLRQLAARPRAYVAAGASYLPHLPRCRLIVIGGGHVGREVAALAHRVDFDVWVVDDRREYCNAERFPDAQKLICGPMDDVLADLPTDASTFCIIVTRGHGHDQTALFHTVNKPTRYLGMIGSKRKIKLIFDELRRMSVSDEALARVHAPLGIDIGSQTVPEIAISIVAELIACRSGQG